MRRATPTLIVALLCAAVLGSVPTATHAAALPGEPGYLPLSGVGGELVAAIGDVSCASTWSGYPPDCRGADLAATIPASVSHVLGLGDLQYETGTLAQYQNGFGKQFANLLPKLHPTPGNHDYKTKDAAGYFTFFGAAAHPETKGAYTVSIGAWKVYVLNSNCPDIGGCGPGSTQYEWLKQQLEADPPGLCQIATYHHPSVSVGMHGYSATYDPGFALLAQHGVELVVSGHEHSYQRFAPVNAAKAVDGAAGTVQFISGAGGGGVAHPIQRSHPALRSFMQNTPAGALFLKLRTGSWSSEFVSLDGRTDKASGSCGNPRNAGALAPVAGSFGAFEKAVLYPALVSEPGSLYAAVGATTCTPGGSTTTANDGWGRGMWCRSRFVSRLTTDKGLAGVLIAGSAQDQPSVANYTDSFDKVWGTWRSKIVAAPAAEDFTANGASAFRSYFGQPSSYRKVELEHNWVAYVLPPACANVAGGCAVGSPFHTWLTTELAKDGEGACQIVISDTPIVSAGYTRASRDWNPTWEALVDGGIDVTVHGGDRNYQRFASVDRSKVIGGAGPAVFTVGTGGRNLWPLRYAQTWKPTASNSTTFGALFLRLADGSWAWQYQTAAASSFTDTGKQVCR